MLDAYSLKNDINLTTTSFVQDDFISTVQAEDNLLTSFDLGEGLPIIDKILASIPTNITITGQIVKNGEVLLEGVSSFNMIYYSEDEEGNKVLNSVDIDVPYSIPFGVSEVKEGDNVVSHLICGDVNVKTRHGRELEILAQLYSSFDISRSSVGAITTDITIGEAKKEKECALEIYLAKEGDTLWDIAKKLNISLSDLSSQNPELSMEIKPGDKIVAYTKETGE